MAAPLPGRLGTSMVYKHILAYAILRPTMNNSDTNFLYWLYLKGAYHYYGKIIANEEKQIFFRLWDNTPVMQRICWLCGKKVKWKDRSVDHVIPKSILYELDLIGLRYDPRNYQIAHRLCNQERSSDISMLPLSIQTMLAKRRAKMYSSD